jgi:hypothetical protein
MDSLGYNENINSRFDQLRKTSSNIQALITHVGIEYTNKIGDFATNGTDQYYVLRDSLGHRLSSTIFHIEILINYNDYIPRLLNDIEKSSKTDSFISGNT